MEARYGVSGSSQTFAGRRGREAGCPVPRRVGCDGLADTGTSRACRPGRAACDGLAGRLDAPTAREVRHPCFVQVKGVGIEMESTPRTKNRGFASMDTHRQREIA